MWDDSHKSCAELMTDGSCVISPKRATIKTEVENAVVYHLLFIPTDQTENLYHLSLCLYTTRGPDLSNSQTFPL